MSRWRGRLDTCEHCGLTYDELHTGMTYKEVRMMLWTGDPDYSKWKYKRRHTVLGLWHQLKISMWREHLLYCEMLERAKSTAEKLPENREELEELLRCYDASSTGDVPF